jgi:hypothetical protein
MNCGGGQVLFIEKGNHGKVKLDGLAIATMGQSPEGQTMMESYGNWNFAYYYIDEKANPEQRKALEAIAGKVLTPMCQRKLRLAMCQSGKSKAKSTKSPSGNMARFTAIWWKAAWAVRRKL